MQYEIKRGNTVLLKKEIEGKRTKQSPSVDEIIVTFTHPYAIKFEKNDTIEFKGQTYFLDETNNTCKKNSKNSYDYSIKFLARSYRATEIALLGYNLSNKLELTTFPINADLKTLAQLAVDNLNRGGASYANNLLNRFTAETNKVLDVNNGTTIDKVNFRVFDFVKTSENILYCEALSISSIEDRTINICYYDENKAFIKGETHIVDKPSGSSNVLVINKMLDIPIGAMYLRCSNRMSLNVYIYKAFTLGNVPDTSTEYIQVDRENVMSFLAKCSSTFNEPFYLDDNVLSFGVNLNDTGKQYEYGRGKGFKSIINKNQQNKKLITVLYPSGSTENLPEGYGNERLTIYPLFDPNYNEFGIIEGFYNNDDIKPTTSGILGASYDFNPAETINDFATIMFENTLPYLLSELGNKAQINFTSGDFNGLNFNCYQTMLAGSMKLLIFVKGWGAGAYTGLEMLEGDNFNITNIQQPSIVVEQAEEKLRLEAQKYLDEINQMASEIDVVCDPLVPFNHKLNDVIKVVDSELEINGNYVINGFTEDLQNFKEKTLQLSYNYVQLKNMNLQLAKSKRSKEQVEIDNLQQQINVLNKQINP